MTHRSSQSGPQTVATSPISQWVPLCRLFGKTNDSERQLPDLRRESLKVNKLWRSFSEQTVSVAVSFLLSKQVV